MTGRVRRAAAFLACLLSAILLHPAAAQTTHAKPIACKDLRTLREFGLRMSAAVNPRTGDTVPYVVIGDAAKSSKLIVMFNGTGGILPDWPTQMLSNSVYSPKIARTPAYVASEDGPVSLCHDYRLILFDYPGVGAAPLPADLTTDRVANDVDAMVNDAGRRYRISTDKVDVVGWSLGTFMALKYAELSALARPERKIGNVVLIASRPGGNLDGSSGGNQAACVTTLFDALKDQSLWQDAPKLKDRIDATLSVLTFPFQGQTPYDGAKSGCAATVDTAAQTLSLSVKLDCPKGSECRRSLLDETVNRFTPPWLATKGVDYGLYLSQRAVANDWTSGYCPSADAHFHSVGCQFAASETPDMSVQNGGICRTVEAKPNHPVSTECVPLQIGGHVTLLNGLEDLFIQWTYGRALIDGYKAALGADRATLVTYDGSDGAGHGVLLQHPGWTEGQVYGAVSY